MADVKFTPGPWEIWRPEGSNGYRYIDGADSSHGDVAVTYRNDETGEANAHLIAAAPDGYEAGGVAVEALAAMMDAWFDYHDANSLTQPVTGRAGSAFDKALAAREKLEAFLAKARGE